MGTACALLGMGVVIAAAWMFLSWAASVRRFPYQEQVTGPEWFQKRRISWHDACEVVSRENGCFVYVGTDPPKLLCLPYMPRHPALALYDVCFDGHIVDSVEHEMTLESLRQTFGAERVIEHEILPEGTVVDIARSYPDGYFGKDDTPCAAIVAIVIAPAALCVAWVAGHGGSYFIALMLGATLSFVLRAAWVGVLMLRDRKSGCARES